MYDVTWLDICYNSFCRITVLPCEWKTSEMMQIYNYCLSGDLKYMNLNQKNENEKDQKSAYQSCGYYGNKSVHDNLKNVW